MSLKTQLEDWVFVPPTGHQNYLDKGVTNKPVEGKAGRKLHESWKSEFVEENSAKSFTLSDV